MSEDPHTADTTEPSEDSHPPTEPDGPEAPVSLWKELRERKVVRVATAYAVVGWGVTIGSSDLTDILALPSWVPKVTLALVVLGFPVALVLAWVFEVTRDGVRRAPAHGGSRTSGSSRAPFLAGLAVGIASVGVAAYVLGGSTGPAEEPAISLDAEMLAILPFQYSGPEEAEWTWLEDAVATLLSRRFTGEIGPRTTNSMATAALFEQARSTDPATADRDVAERLGAGLVLTGAIVLGADGIGTLSATIRDLVSGEELTASAEGRVDSLDALDAVVDRLAGRLLSLALEDVEEGRGASTDADFEALKAFHQGLSDFRRGRFDDAYDDFVRAVEIDSTFADGWIWVADAGNNIAEAISRGAARDALQRAWRHRAGLSHRDSAYLVARRLSVGLPRPSTREELERAYLEASRLDSNRANLWYFLGENVLHRPTSTASYDRALEYFERAVELGPRNSNALMHLFLVQTLRGDLVGAIDAADRLAGLDPTNAMQRLPGWLRAVQTRDTARVVALYDSVDALQSAESLELFFMDQPTLRVGRWQAEALLRTYDRLRQDLIPGSSIEPKYLHAYYGFQELGHPERALDALAELETAEDTVYDPVRLLDAIYGSIPEEVGAPSAAALEARLAELDDEAWLLPNSSAVADRTALELWRITQGDLSRVDEAADLYRRLQPAHAEAHRKTLEAHALLLEAMAAAREGESAAAKESIDAMDTLFLEGLPALGTQLYDAIVLATADTYERLGNVARALEVLERESNYTLPHLAFNARFARERGRLAALTGDTTRAIREYEHYMFMRAAAAPALQEEIGEVQAALAALRSSRAEPDG